MQFGAAVPHFGGQIYDGKTLTDFAHRMEDLGYDSLWVSDHIVLPAGEATPYPYSDLGGALPSADTPWLDPIETLTYLTAVTRKVKLGTSICVLPYRNPVLNAKSLSTIDVLSHGRLIFGVGAGWLKEEAAAIGVPFDHRGQRTNEHIQMLKALWTQKEPRFQGKFYSISDVRFEPKPAQKPHPPIWVGGHEAPALHRAGALGDGWHAYRLDPDDLAPRWQTVQAAAKKAGRDPSKLTLSFRTGLKITDERGGGPGLVGSADFIKKQLRRYQEVGVSHMLFDVSFRRGMETLERFAREIKDDFA